MSAERFLMLCKKGFSQAAVKSVTFQRSLSNRRPIKCDLALRSTRSDDQQEVLCKKYCGWHTTLKHIVKVARMLNCCPQLHTPGFITCFTEQHFCGFQGHIFFESHAGMHPGHCHWLKWYLNSRDKFIIGHIQYQSTITGTAGPIRLKKRQWSVFIQWYNDRFKLLF